MKVKISVFVRSKVDLVKFGFVTQAQKTHLEFEKKIMESISKVKVATKKRGKKRKFKDKIVFFCSNTT